MKQERNQQNSKVRVLNFSDRRREKLFRLRNIRNAIGQSRFAYVLGLGLYMIFAILDYVVSPESLLVSLILRLGIAPISIAACYYLTYTHRSLVEIWSFLVLVLTQTGHIILLLVGGIPADYFVFLSSIVIIFALAFSTLRFRIALLFLAIDVPVLFLLLTLVVKVEFSELIYECFMIGSISLIAIVGGYSRERYIRINFLKSDELDVEKKKSESLLLNILPAPVAYELKASGSTHPVSYEGVTVLFADFVGFSKKTQGIDAEPVITTLDKYFSYFDFITKKYQLEKIKTIGDAYMLAGGLDTSIPTHAVDCVLAAFDFLDFVVRDASQVDEQLTFELRIGIHTGPVIAGVLGSLKFSYDIFGSTVNLASRMEKYSTANKINISRSTYELVKDFFECENRGIVEAKNNETYEMFFVHGLKKELCLDEEGNIPNAKFVQLYNNYRKDL